MPVAVLAWAGKAGRGGLRDSPSPTPSSLGPEQTCHLPVLLWGSAPPCNPAKVRVSLAHTHLLNVSTTVPGT